MIMSKWDYLAGATIALSLVCIAVSIVILLSNPAEHLLSFWFLAAGAILGLIGPALIVHGLPPRQTTQSTEERA